MKTFAEETLFAELNNIDQFAPVQKAGAEIRMFNALDVSIFFFKFVS
jgi:hypothetical protein